MLFEWDSMGYLWPKMGIQSPNQWIGGVLWVFSSKSGTSVACLGFFAPRNQKAPNIAKIVRIPQIDGTQKQWTHISQSIIRYILSHIYIYIYIIYIYICIIIYIYVIENFPMWIWSSIDHASTTAAAPPCSESPAGGFARRRSSESSGLSSQLP